jgi:hypothetical protein
MARAPKPWYRKDRKCWFVTIAGQRHNFGPEKVEAFQQSHELMAAEPKPKQIVKAASSEKTVAEVLDDSLDWCQKHRSEATYAWYLLRCKWFATSEAALLPIDRFKPFHLQQWADSHLNWADGHKRGCMIAIQRPFRWAEKMGLIDCNPIAVVEKPQPGKRDQIVTAAEYNAILSRISTGSNALVMIRTGTSVNPAFPAAWNRRSPATIK